jgi:hypothetical protein
LLAAEAKKMPELKMIEIYSGKDPEWKGWYNLILDIDGDAGNSKPLQGPIDPETSEQIKQALGIKDS